MQQWMQCAKENKLFSLILLVQFCVCLYLGMLGVRGGESYTISGTDFLTNDTPQWVQTTDDGGLLLQTDTGEGVTLTYSLPFHSGAYLIDVNYLSQKDPENPSVSVEDSTGEITISLPEGKQRLQTDKVTLYDHLTEQESRMWLRSTLDTYHPVITLTYHGEGALTVESIEITCMPVYYVTVLVSWVLLSMVFNVIYLVLARNTIWTPSRRKKYVILVLAGTTALCSITFFGDALMRGHDMYFHLAPESHIFSFC